MHNFFVILGLDPNKQYSKEEIKKRWKELCVIHHPDKGGDPVKFREVTHAYNMLTDPSYRSDQSKDKLNLNINFQVPVEFEDAFFGKNITVCFNKFEVDDQGNVIPKDHQEIVTFIMNYPPGRLEGINKTMEGAGLKNKNQYGDALINFIVKQHPRYKYDGKGNIVTQEKVDLEIMLKGGEIEVQTLYGLKTVKVPPGTMPGHTILIKNCGVSKRGNHIIEPQPIFPTKEELKAKRKFNDLDINWQDFQEEQQQKNNPQQGFYIGMKSSSNN